ncbi:Hypothetical predicted protein [Pelobates cultripes]|uniref:Uncharacterized protein n=1 Tax=Pelobates cultripes TaxID=61616 RepID=A0AAD1R235_PELCU|nr:Hypothetical predicted protein [Pelobates cultripes]
MRRTGQRPSEQNSTRYACASGTASKLGAHIPFRYLLHRQGATAHSPTRSRVAQAKRCHHESGHKPRRLSRRSEDRALPARSNHTEAEQKRQRHLREASADLPPPCGVPMAHNQKSTATGQSARRHHLPTMQPASLKQTQRAETPSHQTHTQPATIFYHSQDRRRHSGPAPQ